jgi:hypothetical protein
MGVVTGGCVSGCDCNQPLRSRTQEVISRTQSMDAQMDYQGWMNCPLCVKVEDFSCHGEHEHYQSNTKTLLTSLVWRVGVFPPHQGNGPLPTGPDGNGGQGVRTWRSLVNPSLFLGHSSAERTRLLVSPPRQQRTCCQDTRGSGTVFMTVTD